jgi:hypothetical protein
MPQRAQITSIEALQEFRATLIVYLSKARPTLEEVSADALRTRLWLENEQRTHWENEVRRRHKLLEQAQAELFSARLSNLRKESAAEVMAVHRCRRSLDEAQSKLLVLKRWLREYDAQAQPLLKQMEKLHTVLANDMVKAVAYLAQAVDTLDAYAGVPPPSLGSAVPGTSGAQPSPAGEKLSVPEETAEK